MFSFSKALPLASALLIATSTTLAGNAIPNPSTSSPLPGFFFGIGGSYSSLSAEHGNFSETGTNNFDIAPFSIRDNGLSPYFQLGFWGNLAKNYMWGIQGFYKYLNFSANYDGASGQGANHAIGSIDTLVEQEAGGLLMAGIHFRNMLAYLGGGIAWIPVVDATQFRNESSQYTGKSDNLGAIIELGLRYDFAPHWFLDMHYAYTIGGKETYQNRGTTLGLYTRTVTVSFQEIGASINYLFPV